jgi:TPR repeat protein
MKKLSLFCTSFILLLATTAFAGQEDGQSATSFTVLNTNQCYPRPHTLFQQAAELGNIEAQYRLGFVHYRGKSIPQDNIRAYMWWNVAALNGHEDAVKNLANIEREMTPGQLDSAQELARQCVLKNYKKC